MIKLNYYSKIKNEFINNEVYKKVKDYSKNKYEIQRYYNVGKLLFDAGNNYGEGVIKEYSIKLTQELEKNIVLDIYLILENYIYFQKCTHWMHI